jgi:glycosyltransferase involved in cell wall biosynthesis
MSDPYLHIVVPTFNRCTYLKNLVTSLDCQSSQDFYATFVDNGSTDSTADYLSTINHRTITLLHASARRNWQRIVDIAVSKGSYYLILGDDDFLESRFVESVNSHINGNANLDIFLASPLSYNYIDRVSGLRNYCNVTPPALPDKDIDPILLINQYLLNLRESISIHPSMFIVNNDFFREAQLKYRDSLYNNFFPDWKAHLILGANAKSASRIPTAKVFIGNTGTTFYCAKNSKFKYFGDVNPKTTASLSSIQSDLGFDRVDISYQHSPHLFPWCFRSLLETMNEIKLAQPDVYRRIITHKARSHCYNINQVYRNEVAANQIICFIVCGEYSLNLPQFYPKPLLIQLAKIIPSLIVRAVPSHSLKQLTFKSLSRLKSFLIRNKKQKYIFGFPSRLFTSV